MKRWQDPGWVEEMRLELDPSFMWSPPLAPDSGVEAKELDRLAPRLGGLLQGLESHRKADGFPLLAIPYHPTLSQEIKGFVRGVKGWVENFVILGTGEEARGARVLSATLMHPGHNLLSRTMRKGFPRFFTVDSVDPDEFSALLNMLDLRKTLFNVVCASGETLETMAQYRIVRDLLKRRGGNRNESDHLVITTDGRSDTLRRMTQTEQIASFEIPPRRTGPCSILSALGLLPAAMVGIDIEEMLAGAREMEQRCRESDWWKNPAALSAALAFQAGRDKKKSLRVFRPYVDSLKVLGDWLGLWWVESPGTGLNRPGGGSRGGPAPSEGRRAADRPIPLRFRDAPPRDPVPVFLGVRSFGASLSIPPPTSSAEALDSLEGHTLNDLMQARMQAARQAWAQGGYPSLSITLPRVNPYTVGQLLFLLELEYHLYSCLADLEP